MENTVVIKTYSSRIDAEVDKSFLKSKGIESFITADNAGGAYPFPSPNSPFSVQLRTSKKDFEQAKKFLDSLVVKP